jgi:RluA family pseudouridine synthase
MRFLENGRGINCLVAIKKNASCVMNFGNIIFEDEYVIVIDKPSGLLVMPIYSGQRRNVTSLLNKYHKQGKDKRNIFPCHRLDRETSGIIIFAKSRVVQRAVMDQFREKKVQKIYIAFVQGQIKQKKGILRSYIKGAWPYRFDRKKKLALTKYTLLYRTKSVSVLKVEPLTGRTNQIRIQFRDYKHPLIGERRFAFARDWPVKFRRTALHAAFVKFTHPVHKGMISFMCLLPQDMRAFLREQGIPHTEIEQKVLK